MTGFLNSFAILLSRHYTLSLRSLTFLKKIKLINFEYNYLEKVKFQTSIYILVKPGFYIVVSVVSVVSVV